MVIPRRGRPPPSPLGCICLHPGPVVYHSSSTSRSPPSPIRIFSISAKAGWETPSTKREGRCWGKWIREETIPRPPDFKQIRLRHSSASQPRNDSLSLVELGERGKGRRGRGGGGVDSRWPVGSSPLLLNPLPVRARGRRGARRACGPPHSLFFLPCHAVQQKWRFERSPEVVRPSSECVVEWWRVGGDVM